jgi:hypothetical protein
MLLFVAAVAADDDDDGVDMAAVGGRRRDLPRDDDAMANDRRSGLMRLIAVGPGTRDQSWYGSQLLFLSAE